MNISNNKTVRELIFGALIIGSLGCIFHIGVLSNISIYFYETNILDAPKIYEDQSLNLTKTYFLFAIKIFARS